MVFNILDEISCPFCAGRFTVHPCKVDGFAILTCYCARYPVIAGIPVLKRGAIGASQESADDVIHMISAGRFREALLSMIMPPAPSDTGATPAWLRLLPTVRGIRRLKCIFNERAARRWRAEAASLLTGDDSRVTAADVFDLYYRRSGLKWNDAYDYFFLRFGQPRHLVALSLTTIIQEPRKPLLDLACGYGHLTRALATRAAGQPVIGVDDNFRGLYVAKKFVAPQAEYVCCAGDGPMPFADGFFSVAFCSDAFHYFVNKAATFRELKRVTRDDGVIILVWVHNVHVRRPHDGLPLPPEGYQALFAGMPHRMVADSEVLRRYLRKLGPALARETDVAELAGEPMLSVVASERLDIFKDYGLFEDWPHAEGRLALNPLYRIQANGDLNGSVELRRTFPSEFYMEDHAESREYLPETIRLPSHVLDALAEGKRTPQVDQLVGQFVVLGVPTRYGITQRPMHG